jgi:hypothetical protein
VNINIRDTGFPKMDVLDDTMFAAEKKLTNLSCYVITAPLAGVAKIIMGVFQTIIASLVTFTLLLSNNSGLKERWITHVQNGLGNIFLGILEMIPFIGLVIESCRDLNVRPASCVEYDRLEYEGRECSIQYPSIQIRKWKIDHIAYPSEEKLETTQFLEEKIVEKMLKENSPHLLKEKKKIIDEVYLNNLDGNNFIQVDDEQVEEDSEEEDIEKENPLIIREQVVDRPVASGEARDWKVLNPAQNGLLRKRTSLPIYLKNMM